MNEWNAIGKKKKTQGPCLLPKPAVIHLPIAWLLYTAQTMRALSVKLRGVGHRLNNRARVATSTPCCKWSRHLVNGGAGGKGVFGLNRGTGNWTLYGWEHKQCKKNNNSTSRHAIRIYLQKTHTHTEKHWHKNTHSHNSQFLFTDPFWLLHNPRLHVRDHNHFSFSKWMLLAARLCFVIASRHLSLHGGVPQKCEDTQAALSDKYLFWQSLW
jgi:hypothetical protein